MGHNFYFSYIVVLTLGYTWQVALGAVFVAGVLFILLSSVGLREALVDNIPGCMKNGIPVGIGLLIALVGLEWSGIVVSHPATYVTLGDLTYPPTALSIFGLIMISCLIALKFRGAILAGFILTTIVGLFIGLVEYKGIISTPPSIDPTLFKMEIPNIFAYPNLITVIIIFFFLDLFDSIGTLIGVTQQAGIMKDDKLPKAKECLLSDAIATSAGAALGTSSVTAYIESATGISVGGKTGLTAVVVALLMLLALFFSPLVEMVGSGYVVSDQVTLYPVIAPALIIVGAFMFRSITRIDWNDYTEAIPAFLTIVMMPLSFSITEGISFGLISYVLLKLITGKGKTVHWLIYTFALLFILRYIFIPN